MIHIAFLHKIHEARHFMVCTSRSAMYDSFNLTFFYIVFYIEQDNLIFLPYQKFYLIHTLVYMVKKIIRKWTTKPDVTNFKFKTLVYYNKNMSGV